MVPRVKNAPQLLLRTPKTIWKANPSPLPSCPKLFPFYRGELRTVVATLQPGVAPRKPCPTRPHLDLHRVSQHRGGFQNVEQSTGPKKRSAPPEARENTPQFQTSYKPRSSPPRTPRGTPSESEAHGRATRTRSEFRPSSSYLRTSRAPSNRPTTNTPDWKSGWKQGWREKWKNKFSP